MIAPSRWDSGEAIFQAAFARRGEVPRAVVLHGGEEAQLLTDRKLDFHGSDREGFINLGVLLKSKIGQTYFEVSQYGLKQGLSLENIKEAPVLLPPLLEQTAIVEYVESETAKFEILTTEAQRAIDLLQERRTALISAAVTGQIDVREG